MRSRGLEITGVEPRPDLVERLLAELPEWFGIEEAVRVYVQRSTALPTYTAWLEGTPVGALVVEQHGPSTAEMDVLAVERRLHRHGVGRALVEHAENDLRRSGTSYLQVKTLGASDPSPEYAATRRFYEALGYCGVEEFAPGTVWPGDPCLLMVKHLGCSGPS